MACQMGLRRLFADKRRCAVSDRMTLGAVLVTVFTLLVFDLVLRRPETSATYFDYGKNAVASYSFSGSSNRRVPLLPLMRI